jgi:hypothetical protein
VQVKFGKVGEEETRKLTEFRALPSSTNPVVIFMGVRPDGEEAVFLIGTDASTTGDGKCRPSEDQCTFLYLNVHDKRTIEATDADGGITDYSLELTDIGVKETDGPTTAQSRSDRVAARKARQAHLLTVSRNLQSFGL